MTERIIPVADLRYLHAVPHIPDVLTPANGLLSDTLSRPLRDLRISVTDRHTAPCYRLKKLPASQKFLLRMVSKKFV
jgi:cyclic pyranopterin phosphate synthase